MGLDRQSVHEWKVAIVGAGYMAQEHAKAFASMPQFTVVAVCGRSPQRAATLAERYGARVYDSIAAMYRGTRADVLVVAVNELSMAAVCDACFEFPWVCLLEKPVGIDLAQARQILSRSRGSQARCFVALNRRSSSATRQALAELDRTDGRRLISILDQQDMAAARTGGQPEEVVRNYMFANSIHLIDYFSLFGRGAVTGVDVQVPWTPQQPGLVVAMVHYASGDCGVYQAVWDGPGPWSVSITNPQVRLELRPLERLSVQGRGERHLTEMAPDPIDSAFKPGLHHQAEQILRVLDGATTTLATLEQATASMELCARIYGRSAQRAG